MITGFQRDRAAGSASSPVARTSGRTRDSIWELRAVDSGIYLRRAFFAIAEEANGNTLDTSIRRQEARARVGLVKDARRRGLLAKLYGSGLITWKAD